MTTRVTVKNEDAFAKPITAEVCDHPEGAPEAAVVAYAHEIQPGEAKEFYIHSTRCLRVIEKK